jgi:hypothetical protein
MEDARSQSAAMSWCRWWSACATKAARTAATVLGVSPSLQRRWPKRARMRATWPAVVDLCLEVIECVAEEVGAVVVLLEAGVEAGARMRRILL